MPSTTSSDFSHCGKHALGSAVAFVSTFAFLYFITGPSSPMMVTRSTLLDPQGDRESNYQQTIEACTIQPPQVPKHRLTPIFLASYPGSGTHLSWQSVQAFTGFVTGDDMYSNGHRNVVGIKTHYPCQSGREVPGAEQILRTMVFLRHPMDAMPTFHNHVYTVQKGLTHTATTSAPVHDWNVWRDQNFFLEMATWRKHLEYWVDRYAPMNRLIVPYEQFINEDTGPALAVKMVEFLSRNNGVATIPPEDIPCTWQAIVQHNAESNGFRRRLLRQRRLLEEATVSIENPVVQPTLPVKQFTQPQRKEMVVHLAQLLEKYRDDKVLAPLLVEYIDQVEQRQAQQ